MGIESSLNVMRSVPPAWADGSSYEPRKGSHVIAEGNAPAMYEVFHATPSGSKLIHGLTGGVAPGYYI